MNKSLDEIYMNENNLNQVLEKIDENIQTPTHSLQFSLVLIGEKKCFTTMYQKEFLIRVCRKWNIPHTVEEFHSRKDKTIENIYVSLDEERIENLKKEKISPENEGKLLGYPKESVEWFNNFDKKESAGEIMKDFLLKMRKEDSISDYEILKIINYTEYVPKPCESEIIKALRKAEERKRKYDWVCSTTENRAMYSIIGENTNLSLKQYKKYKDYE